MPFKVGAYISQKESAARVAVAGKQIGGYRIENH